MVVRSAVAVALGLVLGAAATAAADPPPATGSDAERALQLFEDGRTLAKNGDFVGACQRFQQSLQLDPGALGTALNLADCYEKRAQTAKAWHLFDKVARRAAQQNDDTKEKFARDRADHLVVQLVAVDAHVAGGLPSGFAIAINGEPVPEVGPGPEIHDLADPGAIVVDATAPGKPAFHAELRGAAGATLDIPIAFPDGTAPDLPRPPAGTHRRGSWVTGSFVVGGAGAAAVLVGLGFGYQARSDHDEVLSSGDCHPTAGGLACNSAGDTNERHAATLANVSTGLTIGGLALVAGGVALFMLAPHDRERDGIAVGPIVDTNKIGIALGGRF